MTNDAQEYAESVSAGIWADYENGNPYGENTDMDSDSDGIGTAADYLGQVLDIEYTFDYRGGFLGARIAITLGGPNAFIDTREGTLSVYWGSDYAVRMLPESFVEGLHYECAEYSQSLRESAR
jgi:hypothetical protein